MEQTPLKNNLYQYEVPDLPDEPEIPQMKFITVSCRLKPLLFGQEGARIEVNKQKNQISISNPQKSVATSYSFDNVFDDCICQDKFSNHICHPLVQYLKRGGKSSLIFSYGITNSGKTYSILGTMEQPGILLTLIKMIQKQFPQELIKIFACEIYKQEFIELKNGKPFIPRENNAVIRFDDCQGDVINEKNMEELFSLYLQNRSTSTNNANQKSSRSHAIFTITTSKFKIGIVDLAGSQRADKMNNFHIIKETVFINKSLLALKKCIQALEEQSQKNTKVFIPYRQSKLTQTLVEYFNPQSKINIIVNINQSKHFLEQTMGVIDYTSKTKNIKANQNCNFRLMVKNTGKKMKQMKQVLKSHKANKMGLSSIKKANQNSEFKSKNLVLISQTMKQKQKEYTTHKKPTVEEQNSPTKPLSYSDVIKSCRGYENEQIIYPHLVDDLPKTQGKNINYSLEKQFLENQTFDQHQKKTILIEQIIEDEYDENSQDFIKKIRYSLQYKGEPQKYEIEDANFENPEAQKQIYDKLMDEQVKKFCDNKTKQLFDGQKLRDPLQQFHRMQLNFRNYLEIDFKIQEENDKRKLSQLKKVNLWTTQKKFRKEEEQFQQQQIMYVPLDKKEVKQASTSIGPDILSQFENNKRELSQVLQVEVEIEADKYQNYQEVNQSDDKYQSPPGFMKSVSKAVTMPFRSAIKVAQSLKNMIFTSKDQIKNQQNGQKFISSSKVQTLIKNNPLKIYSQVSQIINPTINSISLKYVLPQQPTQVDIVPSQKKVKFLIPERELINQNNEVLIDGYEKVKQVVKTLQTFEVGIQTDEIKLICENKFQQFEQKSEQINKIQKQNQMPNSSIKRSPQVQQLLVTKSMKKQEHQIIQQKRKKKRKASLKKKPAFASSSKKYIAKNTRGAMKKRQQEQKKVNSVYNRGKKPNFEVNFHCQ